MAAVTMGAPALDTYTNTDKLDTDRDWPSKVRDWWYQARSIHAPNRREMHVDAAFKDNEQWTPEDREEVEGRNQPALTFNQIHPVVEWIKGTERRSRVDWKVNPRGPGDEANMDANVKTGVMKYIQDVTNAHHCRSRAFANAVTSGVGWMEYGVRRDFTDVPIFVRTEHWRNIWLDPLSVEADISDARFLFRSKIVDLDQSIATWPRFEQRLRQAAELRDHSPYGNDDQYIDAQLYYDPTAPSPVSVDDALHHGQNRRAGVRLIECWYRMPKPVKKMAGRTAYPHAVYDPNHQGKRQEVDNGHATLYDTVVMEVRVSIFIDGNERANAVLEDKASPYAHNRFPFVPVWAYRRDYDNQPYGVVRNMRDPQEDLNKRRSKALYILSTNRVVYEDGGVVGMDVDDIAEEAARPDGIFPIRRGAEFRFENDTQLAREHLMLEQADQAYIREGGGVTGENLGLDTNANSGRAIRAKQEQGSVVTQTLFDNLRLATNLGGKILLSLIEQYLTQPMMVPMKEQAGRVEFMPINAEDEQGNPLNHIDRLQADFVVSETDWRESTRLAMFESMMEMLGNLPGEVALQLMDMVFEMSDVPEPVKSEWVRRLRQMNGQPDPDQQTEDERNAAEEARRAQEAEEADFAKRAREVALEKELADTNKANMGAARDYVEAITKAAEAAPLVMQRPAIGRFAAAMVDEGANDLDEGMPFGQPTPPEQQGMPPGALPNPPMQLQVAR